MAGRNASPCGAVPGVCFGLRFTIRDTNDMRHDALRKLGRFQPGDTTGDCAGHQRCASRASMRRSMSPPSISRASTIKALA